MTDRSTVNRPDRALGVMLDILADPDATIAVVGATDSPGKYGGIIYRDLKRRGYDVLAVNPRRETVDGDPAHPDLASLPRTPDIVDFVVPPRIGREVAARAIDLGIRHLWFQPGAGDTGLTAELRQQGAVVVDGPCIMVMAARTGHASGGAARSG